MSDFDSRVLNLVNMGFRLDIMPPNDQHPKFAVKIRIKDQKFIGIASTPQQALTQAEREILHSLGPPQKSE